jgi:hypothetical protein
MRKTHKQAKLVSCSLPNSAELNYALFEKESNKLAHRPKNCAPTDRPKVRHGVPDLRSVRADLTRTPCATFGRSAWRSQLLQV